MSGQGWGLALVISSLMDVPKAIGRKLGIGLQSNFLVNGVRVVRPAGVTLAVRRAFDVIGHVCAKVPVGHELPVFAEAALADGSSPAADRCITLTVWKWTLHLFVEAGVLRRNVDGTYTRVAPS